MIKEIDDELYEMFSSWWLHRTNIEFIKKECRPKYGYISFVEGKPVIGGFIHISLDLTMAFILYVTAAPEATRLEKEIGFSEMTLGFEKLLADMKVKYCCTSTNQASLSNKFRKLGYTECDTDVVHLVKPIKGE